MTGLGCLCGLLGGLTPSTC